MDLWMKTFTLLLVSASLFLLRMFPGDELARHLAGLILGAVVTYWFPCEGRPAGK